MEEELEYLREKGRRAAQSREESLGAEKENQRIGQIIQASGIPNREVFDQIQTGLKQQMGRDISHEDVGKWFVAYQKAMFAVDSIKEVNEDLSKDQGFVEKCVKLIDAMNPTRDELIEAIRSLASDDENENGKDKSKKS